MLSLRDPNSFRFYWSLRTPPDATSMFWEAKRTNILKSVVFDNTTTLEHHLDTPQCFKVTDKNGLTLLHIAILTNSKKVFEFLLAAPECPLEVKSDYGETPLLTSLLVIDLDKDGGVKAKTDYFAWKLISKSDLSQVDDSGNTTLSCAALKHHVKMAEVFIQHGVDVDAQDVFGNTALHHALDHDGVNCLEFVMTLLLEGADPRVRNKLGLNAFEKSVLHTRDSHLQETLFLYTYDSHSDLTTQISVILRLAECRSELVSNFEDAFVTDETRDYSQLFYVDPDYLELLARHFPIPEILPMCSLREWSRNAVTLEKLQVLVAILNDAMLVRIQLENDHVLLRNLIDSGLDLNEITEIMCYFLSYGSNVTDTCLLDLFNTHGRCALFEVLLYMDVEMLETQRRILPSLLYDIRTDLHCALENYHDPHQEELLQFFDNEKLKKSCLEMYGDGIQGRIRRMPVVPLLQELARNVFREFLVARFEVRSSRQFYSLVKWVDVSNVYKKIIVLEKALY